MNGPTIDDAINFAISVFDEEIYPSELVALMEELDEFCEKSEDYKKRIEKELQGRFTKMVDYYKKNDPLGFRDLKKILKSISETREKEDPKTVIRWYWKIFEE